MAINAVSVQEAFAQGSSWLQMASVAAFHANLAAQKQKAAGRSHQNLPAWKVKRLKKEHEADVARHHAYVTHFLAIAEELKRRALGQPGAARG
ncbi:hypothetical protein [Shinella zoogloeoides]|uniref:hypothetical protein n=1 Tax=Shinella zoogloeoides TaxID=352475 RepID=UPI00299DD75B|nr:hypothetical protein [Shinella zoogloeoides]WPE19874.1 hypothetical protein ShzoTeo12_10500 [Shinella zoogloeoides]